jgi:hypothetical protein
MKYRLLVCWDTESMDANAEPDPTTDWPGRLPVAGRPRDAGIWVAEATRLAPPRPTCSVRVDDGKAMVSDGPFAETKEAVGGFDILECDSLEEAVEIAAGHPVAQIGTIEVRQLWGTEGLGRHLRLASTKE